MYLKMIVLCAFYKAIIFISLAEQSHCYNWTTIKNISNARFLVAIFESTSLVPALKTTQKWNYRCPGTLTTGGHILTSAQCCLEKSIDGKFGLVMRPENLQIRAGILNLNDGNAMLRNVSNVRVPADFSTQFLNNDICILELEIPFMKRKNINISPYNQDSNENLSSELVVCNMFIYHHHFGCENTRRDYYHQTPSHVKVLRKVNLMRESDCKENTNLSDAQLRRRICMIAETNDANPLICRVDGIGAPLICTGRLGLTGIASQTMTLERENSSRQMVYLFTDIFQYGIWIKSTVSFISTGPFPNKSMIFLTTVLVTYFNN